MEMMQSVLDESEIFQGIQNSFGRRMIIFNEKTYMTLDSEENKKWATYQ